MKMLLISEVFPPQTGGSGRWFWEIYRRLPREEVLIAAGEHPQAERFDQTHEVRVTRLPLALATWGICSRAGLAEYGKAYRQLAQLVKGAAIDQLHCGKLLPEGWLAWLLRMRYGVPYLCYVHGEELNISAHSRELAWMTRRVLHGAERVVVNSNNTARLVQQTATLPENRVQVLHPGVDVNRFVPVARDEALRRQFGWEHRRVVLTVGRLQARKGHDCLIRALPQIREQIPDVLYVIVGDGQQRAQLESLVDQWELHASVQFRGDVSDDVLIQHYQQCDLFVLPNREVAGDIEGFGMVLLEAQACGKPVVAGTSGGTAETMQVPQTGRLVACDEPEPLATVIGELLGDPARRREMGAAGRAWTEQHFAWEALTAKARKIFRGETSPKSYTAGEGDMMAEECFTLHEGASES